MNSVKMIIVMISLLVGHTTNGIAQAPKKQEKREGITWYTLHQATQLAKKNDKKVLVFAEASWCPYCKQMKREVFPKMDIQDTMEEYYYPVKIDIESQETVTYDGREMTKAQFSRQMHVSATPTFIFMDKSGSVIGTQPGYLNHDVYKALLTYIGTDTFRNIGFKKYLKRIKSVE